MRGTVVFDLDGTLADTAPDIMATLNVLLQREGLPPLPLSAARALIGAGARALIGRGFAVAGAVLETARHERLFAAFLEHYADHVADHSTLFPGADVALTALADDDWALAVCTNKPARHTLLFLDALGLTSRFAAIAGRDTFPFCKPDARHLTQAARLALGRDGPTIMVGDSATDVATARNAGVPVIGVSFGYTETPMHALGPDELIDHYDDLPLAVARLAERTWPAKSIW